MRVVVVAIALAAFPFSAAAQQAKHEHAGSLHAIMEDLHGEFLRSADALLREDFDALKRSADAIKGHPMPKEIVAAVKKKLGRRFEGFEKRDEAVHKAAEALSRRAAARDAAGAAQAFARLAQGCVACHKDYRPTLKTAH